MKALGINQTEAILLHSRNYSETSLICELFTRKHGRVSVIAKGARSKKNKFQNIAAPNILASVNYSGKSELKTLVSWEEITHFSILGKNLKILLYLNELIFKLLERENVAVVQGSAFGSDGYFRISYATSMQNLKKAMTRIKSFCESLN